MIEGSYTITEEPYMRAPRAIQCAACNVVLTTRIAELEIKTKLLSSTNEELTCQLQYEREKSSLQRIITTLLMVISAYAFCADVVSDMPRRGRRDRRDRRELEYN